MPTGKTSSRNLVKLSSRFANGASFICLEDVLPRCLECLGGTSFRWFNATEK